MSIDLDRFWAKVDKDGPGDCWLWTAALADGYGVCKRPPVGTSRRAHRIAYELIVGPIPEGLDLDHLCRVRRCVNPAHLEPVTRRVNLLRGAGKAARRLSSTCSRGHDFDEANTYWERLKGGRYTVRRCRRCARERRRVAH